MNTAYIDEYWANQYFDTRLNTRAWDNADSGDKPKALIMATRIIDRLNFAGDKNSATQELQFPRDTDTEIPDDIKIACAEIAIELLDGVDPNKEFEDLAIVTHRYAEVVTTYDRSVVQEHLVAGVPSATAWRYLKPYIRDNRFVTVSRIS